MPGQRLRTLPACALTGAALLGTALLCAGLPAHAAQPAADPLRDAAVEAALTWRQAHEHAILDEFVTFAAIPNTADQPQALRRNAQFLVEAMRRRGLDAELLEADGAAPLAWGEWRAPGATRTYVFYAHYDGQPVDADEWRSPPFSPTLRGPDGNIVPTPAAGATFDPDWRLHARSVSDDKGPIVAMLAALDALRAADIAPRANLRFVFEGEEESGSPNLGRLLRRHRDATGGDLWLIGDGPEHASRRRTVVFGIRGVQTLDITVYGANRDLHSGHYGNWAPNPAMELAQLLASMKDDHGRVLIDGFHDGIRPLDDAERAALRAIPNDDDAQMRALSLARTEGGGRRRLETAELPSLNVRGLTSGRTGADAANVVPSTATASLDIRLVDGMRHAETTEAVIRHVRAQGYHVVREPPSADILRAHPRVARVQVDPNGYDAARTPMDHPAAKRVLATLDDGREPLVLYPLMGGSLPLSIIEQALAVPTITVSTVNHDNRQHAADENLRLGHLWRAIETMAALMTME